jgi:hypothetical protein
MRGAVTPLPLYVFIAWCLVKHRDTFIFTLPMLSAHVRQLPSAIMGQYNYRVCLRTTLPLQSHQHFTRRVKNLECIGAQIHSHVRWNIQHVTWCTPIQNNTSNTFKWDRNADNIRRENYLRAKAFLKQNLFETVIGFDWRFSFIWRREYNTTSNKRKMFNV